MSDYTLSEAATALRDGSVSSRELTDAALDRAAKSEAELHAFLTLAHDGARSSAEAADTAFASGRDAGAFQGIPVALKDNLVTQGIATTAASQILAGWVPPYDGTAVARLKDQGVVIVGKTNLDEFAMGSSTENSAFGPSRNPWNTDRVPGGSSGGSAIAVAAGSAVVGFGSDTGGSIRQPAALCGVVGMKPTYGLVSRYGLIAFASSLDQIGPITRTVEDSVTALEAVAGHDPLDATSYRGDRPGFRDGFESGVRGLKIGVVRELTGEGFEPDVEAAVRRTVDLLSDAGAEVVEVSIPSVDVSLSAYYLIAPAECSANLARFDGVRYGLRRDGETVEEMMTATRADGFGPEVTRRILLGTYALSAGYYDAFYGQAQKVRTVVIREFEEAYRQVDVLVSATAPTTAFEIGSKTQDPLSMYLSDICTIPSNLTGHPAISVPVGLDRHSLPVGFQIMAPALGEAVLFRVARAVEQAVAFEARPPLLEEWS